MNINLSRARKTEKVFRTHVISASSTRVRDGEELRFFVSFHIFFFLFSNFVFCPLPFSGYQGEVNEDDGMIAYDVSSYKAEKTFNARLVIRVCERECRLHVQQ